MLLERLPSWSAFGEARFDDPEFAALVASQPPREGIAHPALSEFTPEVSMLADIFDRLGEVLAATIASATGEAPRVPPMPRPVTEVDRLRARQGKQRHLSLVAEVREAQERWRRSHEQEA